MKLDTGDIGGSCLARHCVGDIIGSVGIYIPALQAMHTTLCNPRYQFDPGFYLSAHKIYLLTDLSLTGIKSRDMKIF